MSISTLAWCLYLAITLFFTVSVIREVIDEVQTKSTDHSTSEIIIIISCVLWSVWFFYFLH